MSRKPPIRRTSPPVVPTRPAIPAPPATQPQQRHESPPDPELLPASVPKMPIRPSRYTGQAEHTLERQPELIDQVAGLVKKGIPLTYALTRCGITPRQGRQWLQDGERDESEDTPSYYFYMAVMHARAVFIEDALNEMDERGRAPKKGEKMGQWTQVAWKLERMFPDEFAQRREVRGTGPGGAIPFTLLDPARADRK